MTSRLFLSTAIDCYRLVSTRVPWKSWSCSWQATWKSDIGSYIQPVLVVFKTDSGPACSYRHNSDNPATFIWHNHVLDEMYSSQPILRRLSRMLQAKCTANDGNQLIDVNVITGLISLVNGVSHGSVKTWKCNPLPKSHISIDFKFGVGDYVPKFATTTPASFTTTYSNSNDFGCWSRSFIEAFLIGGRQLSASVRPQLQHCMVQSVLRLATNCSRRLHSTRSTFFITQSCDALLAEAPAHDFTLSIRTTSLSGNYFINRMLYKKTLVAFDNIVIYVFHLI